MVRTQAPFVCLDWDDTLTWQGQFEASVYEGLWRLKKSPASLVLVTGRGVGFCQALLGLGVFDGVVAENGLVVGYQRGKKVCWVKHPRAVSLSADQRSEVLALVRRFIPGIEPSEDNRWRLLDWALEWPFGTDQASISNAALALTEAGYHVFVSSIHLHVQTTPVNKRLGVELLWQQWGQVVDWRQDVVVMGDSLLDEPLFEVAGVSCAPANVRLVWDVLKFKPRWVAQQPGGFGFLQALDEVIIPWVQNWHQKKS